MQEVTKNKYNVLLFFLLLSTAGGMWGGALKPERVFTIIFAFPLFLSYKKVRAKAVKETVLFLAFLLLWSLVSLLWTPNVTLGISEWANMLLRVLFFVELVVFGFLSRNALNTIIYGWSVAFMITAVIAVWELTTGNHLEVTNYVEGAENMNMGGGNTFVRQFAQATFYNYNGYVTFVCYCLPFLFCLIIKWNEIIKQLLSATILVLVPFILVLNASRGGIIVFFIYAIVFFILLSKSQKSVKMSLGVLLAASVFLVVYFWDLISFYLEYRLETEGMQSSRSQIWECCWNALLDTGFIGCGIGGVVDVLTDHHAFIPQPHNFFIEVLLEFGIIVFIWLIVLMWKSFRFGRNSKDKTVKYVRISSLLAIPFITMIDSGYVQGIGIWAFFGSLLILNSVYRSNNPIKKRVL